MSKGLDAAEFEFLESKRGQGFLGSMADGLRGAFGAESSSDGIQKNINKTREVLARGNENEIKQYIEFDNHQNPYTKAAKAAHNFDDAQRRRVEHLSDAFATGVVAIQSSENRSVINDAVLGAHAKNAIKGVDGRYSTPTADLGTGAIVGVAVGRPVNTVGAIIMEHNRINNMGN